MLFILLFFFKLVIILGGFDVGKSFMLSKLLNERNIKQGFNVSTPGIFLNFFINYLIKKMIIL